MLLFGVLIFFALLAWLQVPQMLRNKWWRDLWAYGVVYVITLAYAIAYVQHWPILSPTRVVTVVVEGVFQFLGYNLPE